MWILCTPYSYIMTIKLTTQIKSSLITKHNFIQVIIFIFNLSNIPPQNIIWWFERKLEE
jgi:hypothetical protein